jgi:aminoglycoside phosphotransferase (APT) family kinase protein
MMHHDEIHSDADLVRQLLRQQHPSLADHDIARISSTGTSNAIYRIGDKFAARLPLRPTKFNPFADELRWLQHLAPHLPLTIPVPVAQGQPYYGLDPSDSHVRHSIKPSEVFPHHWLIVPWMTGDDGITAPFDSTRTAHDLASFIKALNTLDPTGGPFRQRGVHLAVRDRHTREAINSCSHLIDATAVNRVWQRALDASPWDQPSVWLHADLASGNLLFQNGALSSVIDWGMMTIGDPAGDVAVAWELFDDTSRETFRTTLDVDDATWERSKGWALSTAAIALVYYEHTNQFMASQALRKLNNLIR